MTDAAVPAELTGRPREACQVKFTRGLLFALGRGLFRLRLEFEGLELVPLDEPLIVAAAPQGNCTTAIRAFRLQAASCPSNETDAVVPLRWDIGSANLEAAAGG